MKKIIPFLFLLFFLGCDRGPIIEDFKIEGVGLGDSLLDIMTKDEISHQISNPFVRYDSYSPPNLFYEFYTNNNLETYYEMSFFVYANDEKYKIYGIFGELKHSTLDRCHSEQEKVTQDFKDMFPEAEYFDFSIYEHYSYKGSFTRENQFTMPNGEILMTQCIDDRVGDYGGDKSLFISVAREELYDWLSQ